MESDIKLCKFCIKICELYLESFWEGFQSPLEIEICMGKKSRPLPFEMLDPPSENFLLRPNCKIVNREKFENLNRGSHSAFRIDLNIWQYQFLFFYRKKLMIIQQKNNTINLTQQFRMQMLSTISTQKDHHFN